MENNLTYMDCWHFIAPLIPVNTDGGIAYRKAERWLKRLKAAHGQ